MKYLIKKDVYITALGHVKKGQIVGDGDFRTKNYIDMYIKTGLIEVFRDEKPKAEVEKPKIDKKPKAEKKQKAEEVEKIEKVEVEKGEDEVDDMFGSYAE